MKDIIWTPASSEVCFKEKNKDIIMQGVLMPEGEISRNRAFYDWQSVKQKHKQLLGRPVMYNHEIDGTEATSIGHVVKSEVKTVQEILSDKYWKSIYEEVKKLNYSPDRQLWIYEASLDPNEEYYVNKIRRGDLRHVSIQLKAFDTEESVDNDGNGFTKAYVSDIIEMSVVPTPGFLQACAVLAEKYGGKIMSEEINTSTAGDAIAPAEMKDVEKDYKNYAMKKCEVCGGFEFNHVNNGYVQCSKCKSVRKMNLGEDEELAESMINFLGEDVVKDIVFVEELKVDKKFIRVLNSNNVDFEVIGQELYVDESNGRVLDGLGVPYRK